MRITPTTHPLAAVLTAAVLFCAAAAAPTRPADPGENDFEFVVEKMRTNYAGYADKVTDATRVEFDALTTKQRARYAHARDAAEQADAIRDWLAFFKDRHVALANLDASAGAGAAGARSPSSAELATRGPKFPHSEETIRKHIDANRTTLSPLEGVWRNESGSYRVGIVAAPEGARQFAAIILTSRSASWVPGQVKFDLGATNPSGFPVVFRMGDHREVTGTARLVANGGLLITDTPGGNWLRVHPPVEPAVDTARFAPSKRFFLKPLSASTLWLRLPHFNHESKPELDRLLADNAALLARTPNLLIDARANGGGSDTTYENVIPLLYTRPIYSVGVELRVSPDNIAKFESLLVDPAFPPEAKSRVDKIVARMKAAWTGDFVPQGDRSFRIDTHPEVKAFPRRVGILITGAGSSGEQFVLSARESRKVTLFGGPTSGIIDYANVWHLPTPSGRHELWYATSRSLRLPHEPIDNIGIPPDIAIDDHVDDPIGFVQAWLERQVD